MARKQTMSFEEGLRALEALVTRMEGELPLEEAMAAYEEGVNLHKALQKLLDESEKKLRILSAEDAGEEEADAGV